MKSNLFIILITSIMLSGCAGVMVGSAATGAAVVHDRRSVGTVIDNHGLAWEIRQAIYTDNDLDAGSHINVTVYNNTILLSGEVPTRDLKLRAKTIATKAAEGHRIFNELAIGTPTTLLSRSKDSYITSKVKAAMLGINLPDFDLTRVTVTTEAGVVFLMGLVTKNEADITTNRARKVSGVKKVVRLFEYIEK